MVTALLFVFGKELMDLDFAHTPFGSTYSAARSPIVLLLLVYYSAQLFFWGAEFSKVYQRAVSSHAA
jgi:membrane protein